MFGVRAKLFAVAVVLMLAAGTVSGLFLECSLRTWLNRRAEAELWRQARTARDILEMAPGGNSTVALNALAWRLSDSTGNRITLLDRQGFILGDSQTNDRNLPNLENHASREEVTEATESGYGLSRRWSQTLNTEMLYVALPFTRHKVQGIIRVGTSTEHAELAIRRLRLTLFIAGLIGLFVTFLMAALSSHLSARALRHLVRHAEKVARGENEHRLIRWPLDEIGGIAGSFYEIADKLERTVNTLGRERDQIAAILESMSEAVVALDHHQRITLINGAAIRLLGTSARPFGTALIQSIENPSLKKLFEKVKTGIAAREELNLGERRVLAQVTPLSFSGGSVLVMVDITFIRQVETMHRDFVANVSHELRTPVSVICANTETLLNGALDDIEVAYPFMEAISRNAERLRLIIADLLNLAQAEAGQLRLQSVPVRILSAARRALEAIQHQAEPKHIKMELHILPDLVAIGDPQALDQVLINLLDNAVKYTPYGGKVDVYAFAKDSYVRIEIKDSGPGLKEEHRERVFERFYRVDTGRSRDAGGTGLGLSIVKNLCQSMRGEVGVESQIAQGSTFWITLPSAETSIAAA